MQRVKRRQIPRRKVPPKNAIVWDYEPTEKQIIAHTAPERCILYGGAMGGGKSWMLCAEGIQLSLDYPGNRGYICRHENATFRKTTFLSLQTLLPDALVDVHNKQDQYFRLINGSEIWYGGLRPTQAEKPLERIKSQEWGWVAIDEASETQEEYFNMLLSRLRYILPDGTEPRYRMLLSSNPEECWLSDLFFPIPPEGYKFIQAKPTDNPKLPDDYVDNLMQRFPKEWVEKYIKGDWAAARDESERVFPLSWVRAATQRYIPIGSPVELGVDVARYGDDETNIALRRGNNCKIVFKGMHLNTMRTVVEVMNQADKYSPTAIRIDTIGIGAGVFDRLKELSYPVIEVIGGATAIDSDRFANIRAQCHWNLRDRLEKAEINLPDDDNLLVRQMCAIKYKVQSDRRIAIEKKEDMRKRGMKSPDRAESIAYAFADFIEQSDYQPVEIFLV